MERQREERGREREEEMKGGEGGALSYSVFEHILGIKFRQAVFPPASETSRGKAVEVFLGLFCPGLQEIVC